MNDDSHRCQPSPPAPTGLSLELAQGMRDGTGLLVVVFHVGTLLFQTLLVDDGFRGLPRYTSLLSTPRAPSPFGALLRYRCAA